jgi:hypothetical protein
MAGTQAPGDPSPRTGGTGREILRIGLWNYVSNRWAPKNAAGRLAFEIGILIGFFLVLAVLLKLASG